MRKLCRHQHLIEKKRERIGKEKREVYLYSDPSFFLNLITSTLNVNFDMKDMLKTVSKIDACGFFLFFYMRCN